MRITVIGVVLIVAGVIVAALVLNALLGKDRGTSAKQPTQGPKPNPRA